MTEKNIDSQTEENNIEVKRQEILAETKDLNNFYTYLPNDNYKNEGGSRHAYVAGEKLMDKNHKTIISQENFKKHSSLYLNQTPREFLKTISDTIENLPDLSLEKIKDIGGKYDTVLKNWIKKFGSPEYRSEMEQTIEKSMEYLHELHEYVAPLYIELRLMGYYNYDIDA